MGSPIPGLFSILQHPKPTQPSSVFEETVFQLPNHKMAVSSYAYASLSLIGLCALAGAGVGVGSHRHDERSYDGGGGQGRCSPQDLRRFRGREEDHRLPWLRRLCLDSTEDTL